MRGMNTITRISEVLFQKYDFYVPISEIGYESHVFNLVEEMDEELFPTSILDHLVAPFQTESADYTDIKGNYYVVIQLETGDIGPYEVWMVNGEVRHDFI